MIVLVDIFREIVSSMRVEGVPNIYSDAGRNSQILKTLMDKDNSITMKGTKYPLVAMQMPVRIKRDTDGITYGRARIDRIVIATITNGTDSVIKRYQEGGTFKSILYPCYYEFLRQCAKSKYVLGGDPENFSHTQMDNPGSPVDMMSDYVDTIEILGLELQLINLKTC